MHPPTRVLQPILPSRRNPAFPPRCQITTHIGCEYIHAHAVWMFTWLYRQMATCHTRYINQIRTSSTKPSSAATSESAWGGGAAPASPARRIFGIVSRVQLLDSSVRHHKLCPRDQPETTTHESGCNTASTHLSTRIDGVGQGGVGTVWSAMARHLCCTVLCFLCACAHS